MTLGGKLWYALIDGQLFAFWGKRHRDLAALKLGGEALKAAEAYKIPSHFDFTVNYIEIEHWRFERWLLAMLQRKEATDENL